MKWLACLAGASLLIAPMFSFAQEMRPADSQPAATQPADRSASQPLPRPQQAEIYRELLREQERPTRTLPQPASAAPIQPALSSSAPQKSPDGLLLEGSLIIDRPGRLVRSADRSEFRLIVDESDPEPRTLEILKNGLLEMMEREAESGIEKFYITARVTRYRDSNYLYLLKYRRQISHGNLSP
ncbi:MAG: hypothetical protein D6744_03145 [Planctomycetota bacterium]|nr:MAG: hypothetical protein D6744_03145 [Planctomycetota bacterium]